MAKNSKTDAKTKVCRHVINTIVAHKVDELVDKNDKAVGYQLHIRVACRDCGEVFSFPGLLELQSEVAPGPRTQDCSTELVIRMHLGPIHPDKN